MQTVIGIDEAGRGPLAGPVAVGLVAARGGLNIEELFPGVRDSKLLSEKKRERIYALLEERAETGEISFRVEFEDAQAIDRDGIVPSIRRALERGLSALAPEPRSVKVLLDGALSAPEAYEQETIIGGDKSVPLISLASIAAKVARDRQMKKLAEQYKEYGFDKHKGYGTKAHYEALRSNGLCAIHRASFIHLT